jgi:hypothetical protein
MLVHIVVIVTPRLGEDRYPVIFILNLPLELKTRLLGLRSEPFENIGTLDRDS